MTSHVGTSAYVTPSDNGYAAGGMLSETPMEPLSSVGYDGAHGGAAKSESKSSTATSTAGY